MLEQQKGFAHLPVAQNIALHGYDHTHHLPKPALKVHCFCAVTLLQSQNIIHHNSDSVTLF